MVKQILDLYLYLINFINYTRYFITKFKLKKIFKKNLKNPLKTLAFYF